MYKRKGSASKLCQNKKKSVMVIWLQTKKKAINPKSSYSGRRRRSENRTAIPALSKESQCLKRQVICSNTHAYKYL